MPGLDRPDRASWSLPDPAARGKAPLAKFSTGQGSTGRSSRSPHSFHEPS